MTYLLRTPSLGWGTEICYTIIPQTGFGGSFPSGGIRHAKVQQAYTEAADG